MLPNPSGSAPRDSRKISFRPEINSPTKARPNTRQPLVLCVDDECQAFDIIHFSERASAPLRCSHPPRLLPDERDRRRRRAQCGMHGASREPRADVHREPRERPPFAARSPRCSFDQSSSTPIGRSRFAGSRSASQPPCRHPVITASPAPSSDLRSRSRRSHWRCWSPEEPVCPGAPAHHPASHETSGGFSA